MKRGERYPGPPRRAAMAGKKTPVSAGMGLRDAHRAVKIPKGPASARVYCDVGGGSGFKPSHYASPVFQRARHSSLGLQWPITP